MRGRMKSILLPLLVYMISVFVFNEFLIYYVIISSCDWPHLKTTKGNDTPLRTMVLADPHLLGEQYGHWFDKLRREWQMYRSYQTALQLLNPDVVFILGDLTDEGKWASSEQWNRYVHRAGEVFFTPNKIRLHMVMGNHDVGFHYDITQSKLNRFLISFQSKNVQVLNIQDNVFVLVNSMGLEEDDCNMCADVESRLQYVSRSLKCSQNKDAESDECATLPQYPPYKPILLQHFPLYRSSDALCQGEDASSGKEYEKYKEKWDVVSKDASTRILHMLRPRLALSGHTHNPCTYYHGDGTLEITIPSFSWRNRNDPSFLLLMTTPNDHAVSHCYMPTEGTVLCIYVIFIAVVFFKIYWVTRH